MKHIPLASKQSLSTYRKVAIASWQHPRDPSTYSWLDLPVEEAQAFLKSYPSETKPSLTHYVAKIVAYCMEEHDDLNHLLRNNNLYKREKTDVFITTVLSTKQGRDLSGFSLRDVPHLSLSSIASLSEEALAKLKKGEDMDTLRIDTMTQRMPGWLLRITLRIEDFIHYTLNMSMRMFGMPDDRFGSAIISNFGALGIDNALVPLSPYSRCPLVIGMGRVRPMPIVRDGQVVVVDCITISFTFDHRYADGIHGGLLLRQFQKVFLKPVRYAHVFEADGAEKTAEQTAVS